MWFCKDRCGLAPKFCTFKLMFFYNKNMIIELLTVCRDVIFNVNVSRNFMMLTCCTRFLTTSFYLDILLIIYVKALQDLKKKNINGNAVTLLFIFL